MPAWLPLALAVAAALLPTAGGARAATLQPIEGVALADRGDGFNVVPGPTLLDPGHQAIVNPGGSAQIVYDDGCKVDVRPGDVVSVRRHSPCSGLSEEGEGETPDTGEASSTVWLVGGAVVGIGGVTALLLAGGGGDDKPASP